MVKCRVCGEKVDRLLAYKVVIDGKNHYYCTEKEYRDLLAQKEVKDNTYNLINEIFGRKVTNTALFKEINVLLETHTYEEIQSYLQDNEDYLCRVMSKDFQSEYAKIRYFSTILKNNMADFQQKVEVKIVRDVKIDVSESKFKRKNKRKPLVEYEEEVGDLN